ASFLHAGNAATAPAAATPPIHARRVSMGAMVPRFSRGARGLLEQAGEQVVRSAADVVPEALDAGHAAEDRAGDAAGGEAAEGAGQGRRDVAAHAAGAAQARGRAEACSQAAASSTAASAARAPLAGAGDVEHRVIVGHLACGMVE